MRLSIGPEEVATLTPGCLAELIQPLVGKGADYQPILKRKSLDQVGQQINLALAFEVDHERHVGQSGDGLLETGDSHPCSAEGVTTDGVVAKTSVQRRQLLIVEAAHRPAALGRSIDSVIVNTDEHTVGGDVEIGLDEPETESNCLGKRLHGVLWPELAASTVSDSQGRGPVGRNHMWAKIMDPAEGGAHQIPGRTALRRPRGP